MIVHGDFGRRSWEDYGTNMKPSKSEIVRALSSSQEERTRIRIDKSLVHLNPIISVGII